ncbi:MAG: cupin domain-containing protein, partial [Chloroflexota bacterium]
AASILFPRQREERTMTITQQPATKTFQPFQIRPQLLEYGKTSTRLAKTDLLSATVQVIASGGETNLHAHGGEDATWLVLQGSARFYTTDNEVVATLGRFEGLVIPRELPYWFESASDEENLVILRMGASAQNEPHRRIDHSPRQFKTQDENGVSKAIRDIQVIDGKYFGDAS